LIIGEGSKTKDFINHDLQTSTTIKPAKNLSLQSSHSSPTQQPPYLSPTSLEPTQTSNHLHFSLNEPPAKQATSLENQKAADHLTPLTSSSLETCSMTAHPSSLFPSSISIELKQFNHGPSLVSNKKSQGKKPLTSPSKTSPSPTEITNKSNTLPSPAKNLSTSICPLLALNTQTKPTSTPFTDQVIPSYPLKNTQTHLKKKRHRFLGSFNPHKKGPTAPSFDLKLTEDMDTSDRLYNSSNQSWSTSYTPPPIISKLLECVWDFFLNKKMAREQNHTFITLIPKQTGAHSVNQFRPISLCNISYRITSKILANRLKLLLPKIISPLQSAFVPNRSIQDNSIIAHELLHSFKLKRGKGGFMFLKMDMEKTFDKMEWKLILAIMQHLGFHATWLQWIESCISSTSFSIILNGSPYGLFSPKRGLRQGDPLSHFLFILGSKLLSRLLLKEERIGNIKGMKIARASHAINHFLFADDLLLFGKASPLEAASFKGCLDKYCSRSGQSINSRKSSIRFNKNTKPSTTNSILSILSFNPNPTGSIYLGLPILMGRSKGDAFQSIIDSIQSKMEGWRARTLSQAGRSVLIKVVAAAMPSYAMSIFLLPKSLCRKLD
jgi:hypothetical protein